MDKNTLLTLPKEFLVDITLYQKNVIDELELTIAKLKKNSTNSSKPPSSDISPPSKKKVFNSRERSDKNSGGQKGHKGETRNKAVVPDKVEYCEPHICSNCGKILDSIPGKVVNSRQEIDIPEIKTIITEYQQCEKKCNCGCRNRGKYPEFLKATGTIQIGRNLTAFLVYLNQYQHIPYERLKELCEELLNIEISEGTIDNKLATVAKEGKKYYTTIREAIKKCAWVGSDETGCKVGGEKYWEWVWQNLVGSYYAVDQSRGYQAVKSHFGEDFINTLVGDCWGAQNNTEAGNYQKCHPHLDRDLEFCVEVERSVWAYKMKRFLKKARKARDKIWDKGFDKKIKKKVIAEYDLMLAKLLEVELKKKEEKRLQKRFRKHQNAIIYALRTKDVPFDNNSSERAIRKTKIKQKVSGGYRSPEGAERHAIILTILETCKKQGMKIFESIKKLVTGEAINFQFSYT
jgi:transposase